MSHPIQQERSLYRWKRFTKHKAEKAKRPRKRDDVEKWLEKVEAATENAVRRTFNTENDPRYGNATVELSDRTWQNHCDILGGMHDDESPLGEAQELVSEWVNEKLRYDFIGQEEPYELDMDIVGNGKESTSLTSGIETAAHEKWYEDSEAFVQQYLDKSGIDRHHKDTVEENDVLGKLDIYNSDEDAVISALMKNMMEKTVISPSQLKSLKKKNSYCNKKNSRKFRDPKMTIEMRHEEVKEARLRRREEEERKRRAMLMKKEARFKAQQILKEEETQKKIREKQEEEAIQAEMAKLRKEMVQQRERGEKERKFREKETEKAMAQKAADRVLKREEMERRERDRQKEKLLSEISRLEEKEQKVADVMKRRNAENRRLVQSCFTTWCKLVLTSRVKLGKAKAMSDWKCMQRAWSAWKYYSRNQKLDLETRNHEANVRDTRLKEKRAVECARLRSLRKCFFVWKVWIKNEQERKEILKQQQNTKAKMQALLDAVTSGNINKKNTVKDSCSNVLHSIDSEDDVEGLPHFKPQKSQTMAQKPSFKEKTPKTMSKPGMPREAWQVTKRDVRRLKPDDVLNVAESDVKGQRSQKSTYTYDPYQNRHKFQKEVIEQQRVILQEQKRMIQEMHEQQNLQELQKEIAMLKEERKVLENSATGNPPKVENQIAGTTVTNHRDELNPSACNSATTPNAPMSKRHPIVSKMEERAAERARRKMELEEIKRKKEEVRVKKMQEEEEQKKREEEERKMMEIQERREAKRMQKKLEEQKKAAQERMRLLRKAADAHYTMSLTRNHGFKPWRRLIDMMRKKQEVATYHHNNSILKKALLEWKGETERVTIERLDKADSVRRVLLLRRGMRCWKKYGERMEILEEKAALHREKVLKKKFLKYWVDYTTDEKLSEWRKESQADEHNRLRMLRRVFNVIRSHRELLKRELERRQRLDEMRRKVTKLLPDFQYTTNESFTSDAMEEN